MDDYGSSVDSFDEHEGAPDDTMMRDIEMPEDELDDNDRAEREESK
jgi:hypothetical protein